MSFLILSHNNGEGARNLAQALGCKLASLTSTSKLPAKSLLINFGCGSANPVWNRAMHRDSQVLNLKGLVDTASSKQNTFVKFRRYHHENGINKFYPDFWLANEKERAEFACAVEGKTLVARTLDRASQGRGIEVFTPEYFQQNRRGLPRAAVYTEAINKGREYRVHCGFVGGEFVIIDITRKIRKPELANTERPFIWNHDNGYIFVREGVTFGTIPRTLMITAHHTLNALRLDFGAVDIVVPRRGNRSPSEMPCYALEVNTAPGMEGTTVERYASFFRAVLSGDVSSMSTAGLFETDAEYSED